MGSSFTGPIHEVDADIFQYQQQLSGLARYHHLRPIRTCRLGLQLFIPHQLLNQRDDIDKAILCLTESLLLSPLSWLERGPMILDVLYHLALLLLMRSRMTQEPEDAIYAAKYFRDLRDQAHPPITVQRQQVTARLVETLAFHIKLKASGVVRTLKEMTALTQELLTSDPSVQ